MNTLSILLVGLSTIILVVCTTGDSSSECQNTLLAGSDYIQTIYSHDNWTSDKTSSYSNNQKKCWVIQAELEGKVEIYFSSFKLQPKDSSGVCKDWLRVYDGDKVDTTKLIAEYCGNFNNTSLKSEGEYMTLVYQTDGSVTDKGFSIYFYAVEFDWRAPNFAPFRRGGFRIGIYVIISLLVIGVMVAVLAMVLSLLHEKRSKKRKQENGEKENGVAVIYPTVEIGPLPAKT